MIYIFSDDDNDLAEKKWHKHSGGYAYGWTSQSGNRIKVLAHRVVLARKLGRDLQKGELVDHINRDKRDNRRENLRLADKSINTINRDIRPDNTIGYTGVYLYWPSEYRKRGWAKRYRYVIHRTPTVIYSKYFKSPEEAHNARVNKLKELGVE